MNREDYMERVKGQMPAQRWQHTLGVMETAVRLARRFGADPSKAELAALFHDVVKCWPAEEQARIIRENRLSDDLLDYDKELWHAVAGAWVVRREFSIEDEEILNAIRYHTSGREGMSLLEKVVCLADYIEPGRQFPGVEAIRQLAEENLEKALIAGFDSTIHFLLSKGKPIYPLTILARNSLIRELGKQDANGQKGGSR